MKILLLNDTSHSTNWGCQATVAGIKYAAKEKWQDATFENLKLPKLPYKNFPFIRKIKEEKIKLLSKDELEKNLEDYLKWYGLSDLDFKKFDMVVLNGEGSIYSKSGHSVRLLSIIYKSHLQGVKTMVINQSIDFACDDKTLPRFLNMVYNTLDCIQVREPFSFRTLKEQIPEVQLVPDAAFLVDFFPHEENKTAIKLPNEFAVFLGSSSLKPKDGGVIIRYINAVRKKLPKLPIVFLASTKTDVKIAGFCQEKISDFNVITNEEASFHQACDIIEKALFMVGGRFHPSIFAAVRGTPFIPLYANTHKIDGLIEMLGCDIEKEDDNFNEELFIAKLDKILKDRAGYSKALKEQAEELSKTCKENIFCN